MLLAGSVTPLLWPRRDDADGFGDRPERRSGRASHRERDTHVSTQAQANTSTQEREPTREELLAKIAALEAQVKPARVEQPMRVIAMAHVDTGEANAKWIRDLGEFEFAGNVVSVPRTWVAIGRDAKSAEAYQIRDAHVALLVGALTSE